MAIEKILIVDDEMLVRNFLAETLKRKGFDVLTAENGQKAFSLLKEMNFDLVITDMKMPGCTGIDVLKKVKEHTPNCLVIVITAFGSIENAVEAMRLGAFNYLLKPFSPDTIEAIIERAQDHTALLEENQCLRQQIAPIGSSVEVVGESAALKKILADVEQVAKSNASVFISGESGTGKEVIAQALHHRSPRSGRPFIKVNCAAIPETLIESEFFGHEKGSFTGANNRRLGRFELAHGGTLLLDEITEIPLSLQAKLLRAIQEQEFERVGGNKPVKVDVRIISTSNRDIKEAIDRKVLREDLYYRLNVIPMHLPPLRERREDILPLAYFFAAKMCKENHKNKKSFSPEAEKKLLDYNWPGNVRELANIVERAIVMDSQTVIGTKHLNLEELPRSSNPSIDNTPAANTPSFIQIPLGTTLEELEKKMIIETLHYHENNRKKTAQLLGITPTTLRNKLKCYNLASE